jgi:predicted nucleic acid-binding Zn ribbon protein
MRSKAPTPISNIINDILKKMPPSKEDTTLKIRAAWESSVGDKIIRHAAPISFNNKRLVVNVDNSMWLYQLGFLKEDILSKLKKSLGEDVIDDIYFKIGKV